MNIINVAYPPPTSDFTTRSVLQISQVVIHHSAGPITQTPLEIDAFERQRADHFIYMPYNFVAGPTDGDYHKPVIYKGRPYTAVEGATFGQHLQSLSICILGNFKKGDAGYTGPPTQELINLIVEWRIFVESFCPAISRTVGHNETAKEQDYIDECPGSDWIALLPSIRTRVQQAFSHTSAKPPLAGTCK